MDKNLKSTSPKRTGKHRGFQILIALNAFLFLFSIPSDMPYVYDSSLALVNFIFTTVLCIALYRASIIGVALYFFIIAVYYNPFLFLLHSMPTPPALDAMVAISFFIIALQWDYITSHKK